MTNPKECFGCKYYKKDSNNWCSHIWSEYCVKCELWTPKEYYCFNKDYFKKVGLNNA